jgi:hypothetical protein
VTACQRACAVHPVCAAGGAAGTAGACPLGRLARSLDVRLLLQQQPSNCRGTILALTCAITACYQIS